MEGDSRLIMSQNQKRQIENIRQDLEARENKLRSVEDLHLSI
jgi:hypothetical protein